MLEIRESSAQEAGESARAQERIGVRAWLIAITAQVAILLWIVRTEITARVFVSSWTISMPGVLLLLTLLAWNAARRRRPFRRAELLAAYVAVSSTVTLAGYNFFQVLIPTLGAGIYYQSPTNQWERVLRYLPGWLLPGKREGLRGLFQGESAVPWDLWMTPLLAWGSLVLALMLASLALSALLADTWIRQERLAFPIAALPLEMTQPGTRLFRSRLLWLGFVIPVILNSLLALNHYFPSVPAVELRHKHLLAGVTTPSVAALGLMLVGFTPFIVGLAYLAPLDVSFSIWFFLWLSKGQRLLAYSLGHMDAGELGSVGAPYLNEQAVGAFLAMGGLVLWRVWPRRNHRRITGQAADRPLNRTLWVLLVLSLAYILGFMALAGFSWWLAALLLGLYFLTVAVIARVRAEAGFAWAYGPHRFASSLSHIVVNMRGTTGLSQQNIALIGLFHWLWWDLRFALMPAQIEALKIGEAAHIRRRQLLTLMVAAMVVAIVVGLPWALRDSYLFGWGTAKTYTGPATGAQQSYTMAVNWMLNPTPPRWDRMVWMGTGGAMTLLLNLMRQSFAWWPFHPIGYVMAATLTAESFWGHYFMAWAVKLLLLRYGGLRLYRATLPFVFGLILGDIASQTLWSIGASLLDAPVYQFVG